MSQAVYLDYAATTPVDPRVVAAMTACLGPDANFGNPASRSHLYGWLAEEAVENARRQVADALNADSREIVWTSGATEANNLAIKGVLEQNGGSVGKVENWGLRNTTYRINKNRKAHYVMMNVDAPSEAVNEMERQMRIHDDILRYMTIRVEELEEGPSAMMRKSDRDDRGRGDRGPRRDDRGPRRDDRGGDREDRPRRDAESSDKKSGEGE